MRGQKSRFAFYILLAIACAGFFLRMWGIGEQSLWIDEGFTMNGALSVLEKGIPVLDSGAFYSNGILSTYLVAGTIAVFGFDPFDPVSARAPFAFFGAGLVIAAYALYREFFKDHAGAFVVALIVSFSHWEIAWSRQVRGYTAAAFFLALAAICFKRALDGGRCQKRYFAASVLLLALASAFQGAAAAASVGFIAVFLYQRFKEKRGLRFDKRAIVLWTVLSPLIVVASGLFYSDTVLVALDRYMKIAQEELVVFFFGTLLALAAPFLKRQKKEEPEYLPLLVFVSLSAIAAFGTAIQVRYAFPFFPLMIVASVYGTRTLCGAFLAHVSDKARLAIFVSFAALITAPYLQFLPVSQYRLEPGSPQPDFESAFRVIKESKSAGDVVISGYTQLHKVYLGEKGMWLRMNLNSGKDGAEKKIINGVDYYAGAPIIDGVDALRRIVASSHGFVIVDQMTRIRIPGLFVFLEQDTRVRRVGEFEGYARVPVHLYRF